MKCIYNISACCIFGLIFFSCNNDLDVIDDYKETPIIYGLLNLTDSVQYVRLQKAYLGEGNALLMAQNSDSVYYNPNDISLRMQESINGNVTTIFPLVVDFTKPKNDGLFVNYPHLVYRTQSLAIKKEAQYKLIFNNNKTGKAVTASTKIVDKLQTPAILGIPEVNISVDDPNPIKIFTVPNGKVYSLHLIFNYAEKDTANPFPVYEYKTIDYAVGDLVNNNVNSLTFSINGPQFYSFIGSRIKIDNSILRSVELTSVDFVFTIGAEEFYIYYKVNQPSSSISQTIPDFTNLSDGKGIFSSRITTSFLQYKFKTSSKTTLLNSIYTAGRFNP